MNKEDWFDLTSICDLATTEGLLEKGEAAMMLDFDFETSLETRYQQEGCFDNCDPSNILGLKYNVKRENNDQNEIERLLPETWLTYESALSSNVLVELRKCSPSKMDEISIQGSEHPRISWKDGMPLAFPVVKEEYKALTRYSNGAAIEVEALTDDQAIQNDIYSMLQDIEHERTLVEKPDPETLVQVDRTIGIHSKAYLRISPNIPKHCHDDVRQKVKPTMKTTKTTTKAKISNNRTITKAKFATKTKAKSSRYFTIPNDEMNINASTSLVSINTKTKRTKNPSFGRNSNNMIFNHSRSTRPRAFFRELNLLSNKGKYA